ncbi:MAG: DUF3179 domain-containing protein [Deltaproteobacteria bacterium]|nr:DUF3179 domain-containing protein [Deltaproteobacteria bacterium]MBW2360047.1 DUF3179 domain-containing protein [Deltaproteobacteria bacterium]
MRNPAATSGMLCVALLALAASASAQQRNGFELAPSLVPVEEILAGGPPRDGIPALDGPKFVSAAASAWEDDEHVVGVSVGGESRAYPLAILVWHELVNDTLGGEPILVSYCPLCGTAMVFDRRVVGRARRFGVSGLLYLSDLLLYDRATESLWSQVSAMAVTGPSRGKRLDLMRSRVVSWGTWREAHPDTTVLTRDTGHRRAYGQTPYAGYSASGELRFPAPLDRRYHPKTPTVGVRLRAGAARAYPAIEVVKAGGVVRDRFAGHDVQVVYDPDDGSFRVTAPDEIEVIEGFWFAWVAFHPETSVYRAGDDD